VFGTPRLWYTAVMEERGPGPVAWAHRLLIVTALCAAIVYALWELRQYSREGQGGSLVAAAVAAVAVGALGVYLRSLRTLRARLTPRAERR
jgi:hypothetical protein